MPCRGTTCCGSSVTQSDNDPQTGSLRGEGRHDCLPSPVGGLVPETEFMLHRKREECKLSVHTVLFRTHAHPALSSVKPHKPGDTSEWRLCQGTTVVSSPCMVSSSGHAPAMQVAKYDVAGRKRTTRHSHHNRPQSHDRYKGKKGTKDSTGTLGGATRDRAGRVLRRSAASHA